jgi:hypothetical protein
MEPDAASDPLFQEREGRIAGTVAVVLLVPGKSVSVAVETKQAPHALDTVVLRFVAAVALVGVVQMPPLIPWFRRPADTAAIVLEGEDRVAGELGYSPAVVHDAQSARMKRRLARAVSAFLPPLSL